MNCVFFFLNLTGMKSFTPNLKPNLNLTRIKSFIPSRPIMIIILSLALLEGLIQKLLEENPILRGLWQLFRVCTLITFTTVCSFPKLLSTLLLLGLGKLPSHLSLACCLRSLYNEGVQSLEMFTLMFSLFLIFARLRLFIVRDIVTVTLDRRFGSSTGCYLRLLFELDGFVFVRIDTVVSKLRFKCNEIQYSGDVSHTRSSNFKIKNLG